MCWRWWKWCCYDLRGRCWTWYSRKRRNVGFTSSWFFVNSIQSFEKSNFMAWKNVLLEISQTELVCYSQRYDNLIHISYLYNDLLQCDDPNIQWLSYPWILHSVYISACFLSCIWWRCKQENMFGFPNSLSISISRSIT